MPGPPATGRASTTSAGAEGQVIRILLLDSRKAITFSQKKFSNSERAMNRPGGYEGRKDINVIADRKNSRDSDQRRKEKLQDTGEGWRCDGNT